MKKITLLFKIKSTKLPNQLLIKSIDKPQILLFYVLECFHCYTFFTSGKCVDITLMMLPLNGYSRTWSTLKRDKGGCQYGSAPAQGVWGEEVYKIITRTEKMNKEQLFIFPCHVNKIIYPMTGLKTVKTKGNSFPHNKILSRMTHC